MEGSNRSSTRMKTQMQARMKSSQARQRIISVGAISISKHEIWNPVVAQVEQPWKTTGNPETWTFGNLCPIFRKLYVQVVRCRLNLFFFILKRVSMSYFAIVSLSFRVSKFPVSRNLETSENQRKPGFNFDILLMRPSMIMRGVEWGFEVTQS